MMKRIKIFALVAVILALSCASARADIFYAVSNIAAGSVGTIKGSDYILSKDLVTGLAGDAKGYSFKDHEGAQKVLVRENDITPGGPNDSVFIYTPSKWGAPDVNKNTFGNNIYGVAVIGQYLYVASYERSEGGEQESGQVVRVDMKNGYEPDRTFNFDRYEREDGTECLRRVVGVQEWNGNIYVVTAIHDDLYTWEPGEVVEFDKDLKQTGRVAAIGKNAGAMVTGTSAYNGKLYIGCAGGALGDGSAGDYWEVDLAGMTSKKVLDLSAQNLDKPYSGYGVTIASDGTAFLLLTNYAEDFSMSAKLFVTSVTDLAAGKIGNEAPAFADKTGYSWDVLYDDKTSTLWCMAGTDLEARGKDGSLKRTFKPADLGDDIYSLALIDDAGGSSGGGGDSGGGGGSSGGGGGCDAGAFGYFGAFALLALAASSKCRGK